MVNGNSIARLYYVLPSSQICVMAVTEQSSCRRHSHLLRDVQELENEERKARLNLVVEFDRAEFPAPNISSQS